MNDLVISGLWKLLEEAASHKDLNAVKEVYRLLENHTEKVPKGSNNIVPTAQTSSPEKSVMNVVAVKSEPQSADKLYAQYKCRTSTRDCLFYLEQVVLPNYAKHVKDEPFAKAHIMHFIEKNHEVHTAMRSGIGSFMRMFFVDRGITEIVNHHLVKFTQNYLDEVLAPAVNTTQQNDLVWYAKEVIPRLLKEDPTKTEYTLYKIETYLKEEGCHPILAPGSSLQQFVVDLAVYLDNEGLAEYEPPHILFITDKYLALLD